LTRNFKNAQKLNFKNMIKKLLFTSLVSLLSLGMFSQSINDAFFTKVSYIGAFGESDWTSGWANWNPMNTVYPATTSTLGNGEKSLNGGLKITANQTISGVVLLSGWVYVKSGATLTIEKGTIIRGELAACLIIERGGKIMAEGTKESPIVFTSNKAVGLRNTNDWAGVIICGKATNNHGTDVVIEGGVGATYGAGTGAVENDNSGSLKYVRIEFPGYDIDGLGNEINGLTMGSVGSGTTIDYVQVSYSGDDSFEWFGGTVNAKHLIALATEDDDFDTDYGFRGLIQFGLSVRDPKICDTDGARGFESDNDASSSFLKPYTSAVFSNMSLFGPSADSSVNKKHDVAMLIRRNSRLKIYNSVATGYVKGGIHIDGKTTQAAASSDSLVMQNNIFSYSASAPAVKITSGQTWALADAKNWFMKTDYKNDTIAQSDLKIAYPIRWAAKNFIPQETSPLLTKGNAFGKAVTKVEITTPGSVKAITTNQGMLQLTGVVTPTDAVNTTVTYSIVSGNAVASIDATGKVTALTNGTIAIKATANDGSGVSGSIEITVSNQGVTAINNNALNSSVVYPNPVVNALFISNATGISKVDVRNMLGQVVLSTTNANNSLIELNTNSLKNGIYFVSVQSLNGQSATSKIVKK
jgi:hypothetical protein